MSLRWGIAAALLLTAGAFLACEPVDMGTGTTSENDYTLTLRVVDQAIHVGDETTLILGLRRTDYSNLPNGMQGKVVLTTSMHGSVEMPSVSVEVDDDITQEFVITMVFIASSPGVAEVRATFLDATVQVKVLISSVST